MIIILKSEIEKSSPEYRQLAAYLSALPNVEFRQHEVIGAHQTLAEIYLIGDTASLDQKEIESFVAVDRVVRVSREYRILGRHKADSRRAGFEYNGVTFDQESLHVFAGLCAVSTPAHVEQTFCALQAHGQLCARMGAYKPRTSPYSFQGHGKACLPYVFELAGKHGIRVIAMEVTHDSHAEEIADALRDSGDATGVMLQIGTRNTQNFELLKIVGRQRQFPVLIKRGFGITLDESLNAAEYLASEGNHRVVFCLRGMKTSFSDPHRNLVDFSHVPAVQRLTRMPVGIDPSHSVGNRGASPDGLLDIFHVTAQGVIAGANLVLVDFHPEPAKALVDGPQALRLEELGWFLEDIQVARTAYRSRRELAQRNLGYQGGAGTP